MIGIMDWGIGGISVYKAIRSRGYTTDVIYFSDSGFIPYGKTSKEEIRARLDKISAFYQTKNVSDVFVACNAASAALNADVEDFNGVNFHSIIPAGVKSVQLNKGKRNGVIGGNLTMASGIYQNHLSKLSGEFVFAATQPLSALVEAGILEGAEPETVIAHLKNEFGSLNILLLACTHYPALTAVFKKYFPETKILDPAENFIPENFSTEGSNYLEFFTTGSAEQSVLSANLAFGVKINQPHSIKI
ncbi:MAG: aspartate/glutamate racemase family protein [Bdellovibrionota bacterium]